MARPSNQYSHWECPLCGLDFDYTKQQERDAALLDMLLHARLMQGRSHPDWDGYVGQGWI